MDRAWWATGQRGHQELDMTEHTHTAMIKVLNLEIQILSSDTTPPSSWDCVYLDKNEASGKTHI